MDCRREHGDCFRFAVGGMRMVAMCHPDMLEHVLVRRARTYVKGRAYDTFRWMVGEGLVTAEGEAWRQQRRLVQPIFLEGEVRRLGPVVAAEVIASAERLDAAAREGAVVDVNEEMAHLAMGIVSRTVLGIDIEHRAAVDRDMRWMLGFLDERFRLPLPPPRWLPTPGNVRFKQRRAQMERIVRRAIEAARGGGGPILSSLVKARDPSTGATLGEQQLCDQVFTFFLAGYDTAGRSLAWSLYRIAEEPEVEARIVAEARAVIGGGGVDPSRLVYTGMACAEVLRLYPPAWAVMRDAAEDDEVLGFSIKQGTKVLLPFYLTHRHPDFWPDPERFDPERFAPERVAARHRLSYAPFSAGARMCVGNHFAMQELKIALANLLLRFRFERLPGSAVEPRGDALLSSDRPIRMRVRRRAA
jgi:cytochrome P450